MLHNAKGLVDRNGNLLIESGEDLQSCAMHALNNQISHSLAAGALIPNCSIKAD